MPETEGFRPEEEIKEYFRETLNKMDFPPKEVIEDMSFEELHTLWRKNHELLMESLCYIDLDKFPCLATHGAEAGGMDYLQSHSIPLSVWLNSRPPAHIEEAATMLYGLSSSAVAHAHGSREIPDGGFVVCNLGTDYKNPNSALNLDKNIKLSMYHLRPMKEYPIAKDPSREVSMDNWQMAPADSISEAGIFKSIQEMENDRSLAANEIDSEFIHGSQDLLRVDLKDCPDYKNLKPQNEILDGYRSALAQRLESLYATRKIMQKFL